MHNLKYDIMQEVFVVSVFVNVDVRDFADARAEPKIVQVERFILPGE